MKNGQWKGWFITLTYAKDFPIHARTAKRDLATLIKRLRRQFPGCGGVWRLEYQERGAPHFHIIFCSGKHCSRRKMRAYLTAVWARVIRNDSETGTRADPIRPSYPDKEKPAGIVSYLTALCSPKQNEYETGRMWGRFGKQLPQEQ